VTQVFEPLVKMYDKLAGRPYFRVTFVPHPISRVPAARCREYIEGNDPVSGKPVVDEIVEVLTKPLTEEQKSTRLEERLVPKWIGPGTEENKMTDYLPIVLPTEERVAEMLKGTSHKPDEVIGDIRAGYEAFTFTVEKVAANAVMAGAKPEYMPVILAMAASGVSAISTSTQSFVTTIVVNGPIRNEIGMNSGIGAMSPFNRANSVIGRAATLLALSAGGGRPGDTYWGSQGNTFDYNHVTFAENEEALPPGWKSFHVQKDFKSEESAVSFFRAFSDWDWGHTYASEKHKALLQMANYNMRRAVCFLLDPVVVKQLTEEGFLTKESVIEYIYENAHLPLEEFWQSHFSDSYTRMAKRGVEPYASWSKQQKETLIPRFDSLDAISIVVVGGGTNDFWRAGDWSYLASYSIDEWR
jgi:hypothetical protein